MHDKILSEIIRKDDLFIFIPEPRPVFFGGQEYLSFSGIRSNKDNMVSAARKSEEGEFIDTCFSYQYHDFPRWECYDIVIQGVFPNAFISYAIGEYSIAGRNDFRITITRVLYSDDRSTEIKGRYRAIRKVRE